VFFDSSILLWWYWRNLRIAPFLMGDWS